MKEVFIAMREANWKGTPEEYLEFWIKKEAKMIDERKSESISNIDIKKIEELLSKYSAGKIKVTIDILSGKVTKVNK